MYRIGLRYEFDASHHLPVEEGDESRPHEHNYIIEISFRGDHLDEIGFLDNIDDLRELVNDVIEPYRGSDLNEIDELRGRIPTLENLCRSMWNRIGPRMTAFRADLDEIRIWEDPTAWVSYSGDR